MPSRSAKQHRAMEAAAHGHGRLGISRKVAREFLKADRAKARRRNPMKYRMIDKAEPECASRCSRGVDLKVIAILGLIGVGIYFAQANKA